MISSYNIFYMFIHRETRVSHPLSDVQVGIFEDRGLINKRGTLIFFKENIALDNIFQILEKEEILQEFSWIRYI